jgi:site-specific DNA recombinase
MLEFFRKNPDCKIALCEKTDRLYRNFKDYVILEDLGIELHLPKENQIIGKNSRSHERFIHGIKVVMSRNYIDNLSEEVKKGMREKAEQGIFPSRPPLGYRNNKITHTIEIDPEKSKIVFRIFELFSTGKYSLRKLNQAIKKETGFACEGIPSQNPQKSFLRWIFQME